MIFTFCCHIFILAFISFSNQFVVFNLLDIDTEFFSTILLNMQNLPSLQEKLIFPS